MVLKRSIDLFIIMCRPNVQSVFLLPEGRDFSLSENNIIFEPNGPRQISFMVNPIDDTFFEGREDLTLQLLSNSDRVEIRTETTLISLVDNEGVLI